MPIVKRFAPRAAGALLGLTVLIGGSAARADAAPGAPSAPNPLPPQALLWNALNPVWPELKRCPLEHAPEPGVDFVVVTARLSQTGDKLKREVLVGTGGPRSELHPAYTAEIERCVAGVLQRVRPPAAAAAAAAPIQLERSWTFAPRKQQASAGPLWCEVDKVSLPKDAQLLTGRIELGTSGPNPGKSFHGGFLVVSPARRVVLSYTGYDQLPWLDGQKVQVRGFALLPDQRYQALLAEHLCAETLEILP